MNVGGALSCCCYFPLLLLGGRTRVVVVPSDGGVRSIVSFISDKLLFICGLVERKVDIQTFNESMRRFLNSDRVGVRLRGTSLWIIAE
jgi:hypothetical protein